MNLAHLRYFWAVAHDGNLTRAARRLHVSQSAVSVQIKQLENTLGQPLFERRGRSLVLTEAGRVALDHADTIFALSDRLASSLRASAEPPRTALRVGALATLSRNLQLSFLAPILGRQDVALTIRSGALPELLRKLEAHEIDVLLTNLSPVRERGARWVSFRIDEQPVALIGSPHRATTPDWKTLLATEPLVVPTVDTSIRASFDALVYALGVRPRIVAEVDDMAMLRLLARRHVGLAVIPPIVVRDELETGVLVEIAPLPGLTETFYALAQPRPVPDPLVAALIPAARAQAERAGMRRRPNAARRSS